MISGDYTDLRGSVILYNELEYYSEHEGELAKQIVKDYKEETLKELLGYYDNLESRDDIDEKEKELRFKVLSIYIANKLGMATTSPLHYLIESLHELFHLLEKRLSEIEKFKEHRHRTVMGLYTEKSVY